MFSVQANFLKIDDFIALTTIVIFYWVFSNAENLIPEQQYGKFISTFIILNMVLVWYIYRLAVVYPKTSYKIFFNSKRVGYILKNKRKSIRFINIEKIYTRRHRFSSYSIEIDLDNGQSIKFGSFYDQLQRVKGFENLHGKIVVD